MTANFSITTLQGSRALVRGTDVTGTTGQTVLSTKVHDSISAAVNRNNAKQDMDDTFRDFFAPLTEALADFEDVRHAETCDGADREVFVVEQPVQAVEATPGEFIELDQDAKILVRIQRGMFDTLIWVGDKLEILADKFEVEVEDEPAEVVDAGDPQSEGN